jgi:tetratricopeptide (TPR) repeat protein
MRTPCCVLWLVLASTLPSQTPTPALPTPAAPTTQEPSLRERAYGAENRGRFSEAADAFLALAKAEPQRPDWVVAAGRCLGRSGRFKEAIDLLDGARKTFPGMIDVQGMLARTLLLQAEMDRSVSNAEILWTDAAEIAESVLRTAPDDEDSRLVLAQARYLLGDWEQAIKQAEEAVRRHPSRAGAHILLGRIATDRFRGLLQQYNEQKPTGQAAADQVGAIDVQRQLAIRSFQRACELDPTRAHPHIALGQLAFMDQRTAEGRAHFVDALAIDPDVSLDHNAFLIEIDWKARRAAYAEAHRRYAAGTKAQPEKAATLRFHEGRACFDGGSWAEAQKCFEDALAGNPAATNNLYYLFLCAYYQNDQDAAERHAAKLAAIGAPAFADMVRVLQGDKRGEVGAIVDFLANRAYSGKRLDNSRDLNHVIACLKDSADAWNNHAFLCRETGRFPEAWSSYKNALEKEPDSPQLLNDAAVILQYHLQSPENLQQARGMYERAIQLADKMLADASVTGVVRERTAQAKKDATSNLAELPR